MFILDNILKSVTEYDDLKVGRKFKPSKSKPVKKQKRPYNVKSIRTFNKIKHMASHMWETKKDDDNFYFITLTTKQHEYRTQQHFEKYSNKRDTNTFKKYATKELFNGEFRYKLSDVAIWSLFKKWIRTKKLQYITVVERQKDTADIHFHILCRKSTEWYKCNKRGVYKKKRFNIAKEIRQLSRVFCVAPHPSLFDIEQTKSINGVRKYISKYITKKCAYSSMFNCRTFAISKELSRTYKTNLYKYKLTLPNQAKFFYPQLFVERYRNEHTIIYDFNNELWSLAQRWYLKRQRKIAVLNQNLKI